MRNQRRSRLISLAVGAAVLWLCGLPSGALPQQEGSPVRASFLVLTDKLVYRPGSSAEVRFVVTNTGSSPFYLSRLMSECSGAEGSFFFEVLDRGNRDRRTGGCSADVYPEWWAQVLGKLSNPELFVLLRPGEIFGKLITVELPKKKGTYRLRAELHPPGFPESVKRPLAEKHIGVLEGPWPAPVVVIKVE